MHFSFVLFSSTMLHHIFRNINTSNATRDGEIYFYPKLHLFHPKLSMRDVHNRISLEMRFLVLYLLAFRACWAWVHWKSIISSDKSYHSLLPCEENEPYRTLRSTRTFSIITSYLLRSFHRPCYANKKKLIITKNAMRYGIIYYCYIKWYTVHSSVYVFML